MTGAETASGAPSRLALRDGHSIAYHFSPGKSPGVVFLGGYSSAMTGTKASALEAWCRARGQAFVRFDYLGHGQSSGRFADGTIGLWAENALAILERVAHGPQILVGSSMGGWIMLLAARARPERVRGLVGIASAPDFTDALLWRRLSLAQRRTLRREGALELVSESGAEPVLVTRALIAEGRRHRLLSRPIAFAGPVRLFHGLADSVVPWQTSVRLAGALASTDTVTVLIKNGDHRLSAPDDLARLYAALDELLAIKSR